MTKRFTILVAIIGIGLLNAVSAGEVTRTIKFAFKPIEGEVAFVQINKLLDNASIGSSSRMLLKLPNGDLRILQVSSNRDDDPTFIGVSIQDPRVSAPSNVIFSTDVKLEDGVPFTLIETSEGDYTLTVSWGQIPNGSNKTE